MRKLYFLISLLLVFQLVGCDLSKGKTSSNEGLNNKSEQINKLAGILDDELSDISAQDDAIFQSDSSNYNIYIYIFGELNKDEDRIIYDIIIDQPKQYMEKVVVSGLLNQEMVRFIRAESLGFSNNDAINSKNISIFTLEPGNKEIKGISSSRGFLLDRIALEKEDFYKYFKEIKVKVTWTDSSGAIKVDYIKPKETLINVDEKISNYYK